MNLSHREMHEIWRIVGECRELGDDANLWMHHLAGCIMTLVGAGPVASGQFDLSQGIILPVGAPVDTGWQGFNRAGWIEALRAFAADARYHPIMNPAFDGAAAGRVSVINRPLVLPKRRDWHASLAYETSSRLMGTEDALIGMAPMENRPGDIHTVVVYRGRGERDFNARERLRVSRLLSELSPLIGGPLASHREPQPSALSRRCRQTLACLLEGNSDKQIAQRLALSAFTVHEYVKTILRHFGVGSRGELLARWIRRSWRGRCAWQADPSPADPLAARILAGAQGR